MEGRKRRREVEEESHAPPIRFPSHVDSFHSGSREYCGFVYRSGGKHVGEASVMASGGHRYGVYFAATSQKPLVRHLHYLIALLIVLTYASGLDASYFLVR